MKIKLENSEVNTMSDEDLQLVTGGATVTIDYPDELYVLEYSCPKCGSEDLEGIEDGKVFYRAIDVYNNISCKTITCRQCGHSDLGVRFTLIFNGKKVQ